MKRLKCTRCLAISFSIVLPALLTACSMTQIDPQGPVKATVAPATQETATSAGEYYKEGNDYYGKKEYDQAITYYSKAIAQDPNYAMAYYARGTTYAEKGDNDTDPVRQ